MKGWLPDPPDLGPFRFTPQDPARPHAHLSDGELRERRDHLALRALGAWRAGEVTDPRLHRLLARVAACPDVRGYFTPTELQELEVEP